VLREGAADFVNQRKNCGSTAIHHAPANLDYL
jgi:hypothetical protein